MMVLNIEVTRTKPTEGVAIVIVSVNNCYLAVGPVTRWDDVASLAVEGLRERLVAEVSKTVVGQGEP